MHDVHYMLAAKLTTIAATIEKQRGLIHHEIYMNGERPTAVSILPENLRGYGAFHGKKGVSERNTRRANGGNRG